MKHFCDYCDDYCDVIFKERKKTYKFKDEQIEVNEKYAECVNCKKEVTDEELGNETLRKLSYKYSEIKGIKTQ